MIDANIFIKEQIKVIDGVLIIPGIPENKLNNAIKAFKCEDSMKSIIALYDNTLLGSAKDGLIFTGEKMIFKHDDRIENIYYAEINQVSYYEEVELKGNGKRDTIIGIKIQTNNGEIILKNADLPKSLYKPLELFLQKMLDEVGEFKEVNLLKPLEEMPNELKIAYIKIIINMAFEHESQIDEKELAEIYSLMSRINIEDEVRVELRSYIMEISESISEQSTNLTPVADLIAKIKANVESIHQESVMVSLVKDLICVYVSTQLDFDKKEMEIDIHNFTFLTKHKELFGLTDDKIEIAREAVEQDFKILYEDVSDDMIQKTMKDFAAKAASVSVPIGAVYLSGSVMGLSAAGMTSGLATLGMGGMLGLSSMATGIGVAVLLGVGVYQGVKYITRDDSLSRYQMREAMLHEAIKQTQKTISMIIGDINVIVKKLNEVILNHDEQQKQMDKVREILANPTKLLQLYQAALTRTNNKNNECINMETRCKCPLELEISRISHLANEPTKKETYQFIISCYEEKSINDETKLTLKSNIPTQSLENLSNALEWIGYFDTKNIVKDKADKASNLMSSALNKGKGFFGG
ncbi:hypothetical protein [Helicobacter sp. UBA3407]|uniref:hypothetical protein n=1 Tax=Helicobacter TaxID=209 RepID=UPI00263399F3|nr:hypothetical protein [Helicobacter sp. UBA3407]